MLCAIINTYTKQQGADMKGTLRTIVGLLVVFGSVGGMDTATDRQLLILLPVALMGLAMMYSGVVDLKRYNA